MNDVERTKYLTKLYDARRLLLKKIRLNEAQVDLLRERIAEYKADIVLIDDARDKTRLFVRGK